MELDIPVVVGDGHLGADVEQVPVLRGNGCKVHLVSGWPTVENVAAMLAQVAAKALADMIRAPGCEVTAVRVAETHVNEATWLA